MFTAAQALKLHEYDSRPLQAKGAREWFLEEAPPIQFVALKPRQNGYFCVSLKELLKPGVLEELYRRFP